MRQPNGAQTDEGRRGWTRSPEPACGPACGRRDPTPIADDGLAGEPGLTARLVARLRWAWESQWLSTKIAVAVAVVFVLVQLVSAWIHWRPEAMRHPTGSATGQLTARELCLTVPPHGVHASLCRAAPVCNLGYRPSSAGLVRWDPSRRRQRVAEAALAVGAHAPDLTAPDQDGQSWHLAEALELKRQG